MSTRKRVLWDEQNLNANEEYRRLHPVTMRIDEPKTPYCAGSSLPEEGEDEQFDHVTQKIESWEPEVNDVARKAKLEAPLVRTLPPATDDGVVEPKKNRPSVKIAVSVSEEESMENEKKQHEAQFKHMRKAVYADEGAKFKLLLSKSSDD